MDDLKQQSVLTHNLWKSAGSLRSGDCFEIVKDAKLAVRDAANEFEGRLDDELLNSYLHNDFNKFWKLRKNKVHTRIPNISQVADKYDDLSIANEFADYFSKVSVCSKQLNTDISVNTDVSSDNYLSKWFLEVEDVDCAVQSLKCGKAAGADGVAAEHLKFSHPSLICHLKNLFNLIMLHGYVPSNFGCGIIVPILKDRLGDVSSLDNYRASQLVIL